MSEPSRALEDLQGAWVLDSGTHLYAQVVDDDLIAPYCYGGNEDLVGVYYAWKWMGELWFARFAWLEQEIAGFSFVRQISPDELLGTWWFDEEWRAPSAPPDAAGEQARWQRRRDLKTPRWASQFLLEVQQGGLASRLDRR